MREMCIRDSPWTLPANTAVSLAPDADYVMVTVGGDNLIMAKDCLLYTSPIFTIIMPKYSSLSISSRACSSVMPFAARSSASFSA